MFKKIYSFLTLLTAFLWLGTGSVWGTVTITPDSPYTNDFNSETTDAVPTGWTKVVGTTYNPGVDTKNNWSGYTRNASAKALIFTGYNSTSQQLIALPQFSDDIKYLTVEFYYKTKSSTYSATMSAGYITNLSNKSTYVATQSLSYSSDGWTKVTLTFDENTPDGAYVAISFQGTNTSSSKKGLLSVEDVTVTTSYVEPAGGCANPTLGTPTILPDGVTVTWTAGGEETAYQYACVTKGATPETWTDVPGTELTLTLHGLTAGTSYDLYVRSDCGSEQSTGAKVNFTPTCPAPSYPTTPVTDKTHNSATVTWIAASGITKYQYVCVQKNATPNWEGVVAKEATSAALSNLNELTDYDFYVRSWYSATAQSAAVKTSFTTNADCSAKTVDALHDWTEDFTNQTTSAMPACWTAAGNTSAVYVASSGYVTFSTGKALYFTGGSGTEAIAILPEFSNDLNTLQIAFSHIEESNTKSGQIKLGYYKNSAFQSLKTYDYSTSWKNESAYALSGVPEGARLAFSYTPVNSAWTAAIDNITVSLAPSCANPTGLTVDEIETTSAQISWTSDADNFALEYKKTSDENWTAATGTITSPFTLEGLEPNETEYTVRVKAICTSGESSWVQLAQPFKTDCEAKSIGWSENFDGALSCWSKDNNWTVYTYNGHSGSNSMRFNASAAGNLVLPAITLDAKAQLSFWHSSNYVTCSVYANSVAEENKLAEFAKNGENWKKDSVDLSAFNGQTVTLIIRGNYVANNRYLYIDDVAVTALPCEAPTNLTVATGATTATLAWDSNETAWNLQYKAEGDADWTEEAVNAKSFKLTNLTVATNYQARVQSACGGDFAEIAFSTWCDAQNVTAWPIDQTFGTTVPECWVSATATPLVVQSNYLFITGVTEQIAVLPLYNIDLNKLSVTLTYAASGSLQLGYINNADEFVAIAATLESGTEIDLADLAPAAPTRLAIKYTGANANSASISRVYIRKTPTCQKPVISPVDADKESAVITWTNTNAETWNLQFKTGSADWTTIAAITENPYTLNNLAQGTTYSVRVQGACTDEDSDWSEIVDFTTDCDVIAALPFTETFDAALSNCWKIYDDNTSYYAHSVYDGKLRLPGGKTGAGHVVVLPEITADLAKASLTITYSATVYQPEVGYVTDATDASTFAPIEALNLSSSATTAYVALATVPANAHIALRYAGTGTTEGDSNVEGLRVSRVEVFNDTEENEGRFEALNGETLDDLVLNRTLLMNGDYNTLCLPFSLDAEQLAVSPLANFKIKAFDYATIQNEELLIGIAGASSIEAGVPCFVANQGNEENRAVHIFHNVTISASAPSSVDDSDIAFKGVFNPVDLTAQGETDDHNQLFLAAGNTIYWPAQNKTVKGFRAYFNVLTSNPVIRRGMPARIVERTEVVTGIDNTNADAKAAKVLENNQVVIIRNGVKYNIQGQVISK